MTPPQAEIAVVLGAKTKGNVPTPVFQGRIEYALQLYREGKVRRLLFTGAPGDPPQALVAKRIAMEQGVPESAILVETRSTRTLENLRLAKELFPEITRQPVLLISDPLHLRRAIQIAGDLGLNAVAAPTPTTRIRSRRSRIKFTIRETFAYLWYQIERRLRN